MNLLAAATASLPGADESIFSNVLFWTATIGLVALVTHLMIAVSTNRRIEERLSRHPLTRYMYIGFLVAITVLAVTSFGSLIITGHLLGYALLIHLMAAGAFVFLLLGVAAMYLPHGEIVLDEQTDGEHRWWLSRWSVWGLVLASIVAAGTMFLSMLPILDTPGLLQVAEIHRYAGLVVVVTAVAHAYSLCCVRFGWR